MKPGVACPRHLQEGDRRENACPPVAYFYDSIRVSSHVFRLADKFHLDRSIIWENRHTRTKHEAQTRSLPAFPPAVTLFLAVLSVLLAPRRYSPFSSLLGGTLQFFCFAPPISPSSIKKKLSHRVPGFERITSVNHDIGKVSGILRIL